MQRAFYIFMCVTAVVNASFTWIDRSYLAVTIDNTTIGINISWGVEFLAIIYTTHQSRHAVVIPDCIDNIYFLYTIYYLSVCLSMWTIILSIFMDYYAIYMCVYHCGLLYYMVKLHRGCNLSLVLFLIYCHHPKLFNYLSFCQQNIFPIQLALWGFKSNKCTNW